MANNAVLLKNVRFSYTQGTEILKDVSLTINTGEYVCIVGHNGSGKSTISKIIMGLIAPSSGSIEIFDKTLNYSTLKKIRNDIGIVFQNPDSQFVAMTAEDDIAFGLENRKYPQEKMKQRVLEVARIVGIEDLLQWEPYKLSGGQKQRVAIAGVLAFEPRLIILDEATSMLDPKGKRDLKKLVLQLRNDKTQKTIISITHDMEEIVNADKVIVMFQGKVQAVGKPGEIFSNYQFIKEMKLNFPFILHLSSLIHERYKEIEPTINSKLLIESLANGIKHE